RSDSLPTGRRIGHLRLDVLDRQSDHELTARARTVAVRVDGSAVHLDESPREGEPYPETRRMLTRVLAALEQVEYAGHRLRRNPGTVIAHAELGTIFDDTREHFEYPA